MCLNPTGIDGAPCAPAMPCSDQHGKGLPAWGLCPEPAELATAHSSNPFLTQLFHNRLQGTFFLSHSRFSTLSQSPKCHTHKSLALLLAFLGLPSYWQSPAPSSHAVEVHSATAEQTVWDRTRLYENLCGIGKAETKKAVSQRGAR